MSLSRSLRANRFSKASMAYRRWRDSLGARASLFTDDTTRSQINHQIKVSQRRMEVFDRLPPAIRRAIAECKTKQDAEHIAQLLQFYPAQQILALLLAEHSPLGPLKVGKVGTARNRPRSAP